jgi:hypothetical protein
MLMLALQSAGEGLTLSEVLTDLPHDPAALVIYVIVALFVFFTWYGSRKHVIERYSDRHGGDRHTDVAEGPLVGSADSPLPEEALGSGPPPA